jgi:hypothetical protein
MTTSDGICGQNPGTRDADARGPMPVAAQKGITRSWSVSFRGGVVRLRRLGLGHRVYFDSDPSVFTSPARCADLTESRPGERCRVADAGHARLAERLQ